MVILQDSKNVKNVTVYNFADYGTAINVTMKEDNSFVISEQPMFTYNNELAYLAGLVIENGKYYFDTITGVGTENTLTFNGNWMFYQGTGILALFDPATITLEEGEFTYPVIPDVAATPADPEILGVTNYDAEKKFGAVAFTIPTTDVDGNELKESKLFYQLYSDIAGDIQPITFSPDLYKKLTEDMSIIPYSFTDNYDFEDDVDYKVVYMNYDFSSMYDRIGVKSIYTGGDETNESEIVWAEIEKPVTSGDFTFNFNVMSVPTSNQTKTDGDITQDVEITEGIVTLTITPSTTTTANRFWSTQNGPQLRVYSGTLTFTVPEGSVITAIDFSQNTKWNEGNSADSGEFDGTTWTGSAQTVVITIAANTQLNAITVTVESGEPVVEEDELVTLPEGVEAEDYTLNITQYNWNGDDWSNVSREETAKVAFDGNTVYASGLAYWFKAAFVKGELNADGQVVFKSGQLVGEDNYGKEYLIGATGEGEDEVISDFVFNYDAEARTLTLAEGYTIYETDSKTEITAYTYAESAIYTPGAVVMPDVVMLPDGAEVETWYLSANNGDNAAVTEEVHVAIVDGEIYVQGLCSYLPDAWVKGTIDGETATFASGQFYGTYAGQYNFFFVGFGEAIGDDVVFTYDAKNGVLTTKNIIILGSDKNASKMYDNYYNVVITRDRPESFPVEAPEDLVTETYTFTAKVVTAGEDDEEGDYGFARKAEASADVTFDFNTMDVAVSSNDNADGDITENLVLTKGDVTLTVSPKDESSTTPNRFWSTSNGPQLRVYSGTLTFEVPEGKKMTQIVFNAGKWNDGNSADSGNFEGATWTGDAQTVVVSIAANTQINNIAVTVEESDGDEPVVEGTDYTYQIQVGFDGNDVYFSGMNGNVADMWMKGTLSEDGKTVTIPACQYMGQLDVYGIMYFDYFITAMDADGGFADIVLNYDAEAQTFTTDQTVVLNGIKDEWDPYQTFNNVVITKMPDFAATPADPTFESFNLSEEVGYSKIYASIPTEDVDGNELLTSKLFYIVWIEKDGKEQPYTFSADLYSEDFDEDMTEIPYTHDGYDIYGGGEIIYLEDPLEELASWTKVGIQSVYYGGGERNCSNIVWSDITTGIAEVTAKTDSKNAVIFDLQGRRVAKATKGLYIINGKKVVIK